ncbi:MAG: cation diffusion facilitator family transporter [Gammaproteobacteria bacterium]|nr:cation diffusion facilitator family transporter [Gammaproteobacteria bacterium]MDE0248406.1 cation diffusion facilitator family transporter [Gammaproteobacteria bacterium]
MTLTTQMGSEADPQLRRRASPNDSNRDSQRHPGGGPDRTDDPDHAIRRSLTIALVLIAGYMIAEVTAGFLTGSLVLLAHAGHMLADAVSIGLALVATRFSAQSATAERTYGFHRTEVLAALVNALTLWGISVAVLLEGYRRLSAPPEIQGELLLIVGSIGLVVNVSALWLMHGPAEENVTVAGVLQHMIIDLLGSVAVVVAGVLVWLFGWAVADPALSLLVGVLILSSTWRLLATVLDVLLEGTPEHIDVYALCYQIEELPGVVVIHDVHCWSLAPGYDAMTAHVLVEPGYDADGGHDALLDRIRDIAYGEFDIAHITIQLETSAGRCMEAHHVDHLLATART